MCFLHYLIKQHFHFWSEIGGISIEEYLDCLFSYICHCSGLVIRQRILDGCSHTLSLYRAGHRNICCQTDGDGRDLSETREQGR
jgi:hypothetical protein